MSDRFPGLGSDPAPGDPEEARRCGREYARAAAELDELAGEVARLADVSSYWRGAAATAFTAALWPLPGQLGTAASSCTAIAARLTAWAAELEELQGQARVLERAARAALERLQAAHARAASLPATAATGAVLPHAVDVAEPEQELRRLELRAGELHGRWRAAGRHAAAAVDAATAEAPVLPRSLGELVWEHRVGISRTANTASLLSVPALAIPVAGPVVSGSLSAVAFAGHTALAVHADGSTADVALGAVGLGLGGAASAVKHAAQGPVADLGAQALQRGLERAGIGTWAIGTGRSLRGGSPPPPPSPPSRAAAASSPALRRLLVAPVTDDPSRERR